MSAHFMEVVCHCAFLMGVKTVLKKNYGANICSAIIWRKTSALHLWNFQDASL